MDAIKSYVPSVSQIKSVYTLHKTAMVSLAIMFVASFISMVTSAYCANNISMSECYATDKHAKDAHQWATTTAVLSTLVATGSVVCLGYMVYRYMKKSM